MKRIVFLCAILAQFTTMAVSAQVSGKLVSTKTQIKFFSSTPAEDIQSVNLTSVSTINRETGGVVFSAPMQGFEFEKVLMQKYFNGEDFLNTQAYPKAKLTARITNLGNIDFTKNGTYSATVEGELTIKDKTRPGKEAGTLTVKGDLVEVQSKFNLTLADFGITFVTGKPSTNIAKAVELSVLSQYRAE